MTKNSYARLIIKYRWFISIFIPVFIIGLFILNIHKAGVETDWKIWFDEDSKIIKNFDHFKDTFGTDDRVLLVLKSPKGIFNKEILNNIKDITEELWQTKKIARVDSITNYQYVYLNPEDKDEIIVEDFIENLDTLTPKQLLEKKAIATTDVQTKNLLISSDGTTAVILARMVYSKNLKPDDYISLNTRINEIIQKYKLPNVQYHNLGMPSYTKAFVGAIKSNFVIFIPILLLTVFILLIVIFRNIWGVILPSLVVIFTILFIAGFTFGLGYKLNTLTSMFPIFVIAIGIADSIHIFSIWHQKRKEGISNEESIIFSIEKNLFPAFITSFTTVAGFLSLSISKIVPLQAFGIVIASGSIIAFILSVVFLPALLTLVNPKVKPRLENLEKVKNFISKYTNFVINNNRKIILVSVFFTLLAMIGFKDVNVDTEFLKQFSEDNPTRKSVVFVQNNITGTIPLEIIIDSKEKDGINKPDFLNDVDNYTKAFQEEFPRVRHINSLLPIIKKYNKLFNGDNEAYYKIPNSKALVSQYLLLYSLSLPQGMGINDMKDVNNRYLRSTVMINIASEQQKLQMYNWTQNWWKENSKYSATVEGLTMISGHMRVELTNTLIYSISLALIFVTILFWFTFRSKTFMIASTLPNIAPLLIAIGIAGWSGINVDLGMAIVVVVIIGVAIDDSVHFLSKYKVAFKKYNSSKKAIEASLFLSGNAIVTTTIILVLGFCTFLYSDFALYSNFGIVSAVALFLAMVFDLMLLPAILSLISKK